MRKSDYTTISVHKEILAWLHDIHRASYVEHGQSFTQWLQAYLRQELGIEEKA